MARSFPRRAPGRSRPLRQQQTDTGIQAVLIASRLREDSADRAALADLAAAIRAPTIHAGYPGDWQDQTDGLHAAMELASDLLDGSALQSLKATFRMRSDQPNGFASGAVLRGTLYVESSQCPMGCWELPLTFAVTVP